MLSDQNKAKSLGEKMFDAVITASGEPNEPWAALPSDIQIRFEQASIMFLDAAREEGRQSAGERVGDPKTIREDVFHTVRRAIRNEVVAGDYGKLLGVDQAANFAADEVMALLSSQAAPVEQKETDQ